MKSASETRRANRERGRERATLTRRIAKAASNRRKAMANARERKAAGFYGDDLVRSAVKIARMYAKHERLWIDTRREFDEEQQQNAARATLRAVGDRFFVRAGRGEAKVEVLEVRASSYLCRVLMTGQTTTVLR